MATKQQGVQWKTLGKDLILVVGIVLLVIVGFNIKKERAEQHPDTNTGEKYFPNAPKFGVKITITAMVSGTPSQALSAYATNAKDTIRPEFCSVLIGASGTSGCTLVFNANAHEGDEITLRVYQMFELAQPKNRRIFYRRYTLSKQLPSGIDPNVENGVQVEFQILPPFPEKTS